MLIEQVLVNVLDHALKYTPRGSPLALTAWATADTVTVEVADRGPGLPPGEEQRIFDKFYRVPCPAQPGGTGLGLTMSRGLVEAHGGRIWADNRPGGGTVVRFTLPLTRSPPSMTPEQDRTADHRPASSTP